jgi:hypothetical protein
MIGKMRLFLARATAEFFVEYSLVITATIVALTNILLVLIVRGFS